MPKFNDHTGKKVGRWTVLGYHKNSLWRCRCDCGNEKLVASQSLQRSASQSCGCLSREHITGNRRLTHGEAGGARSKEYRCWTGMIGRCANRTDSKFPHYGGRGIKIWEPWRNNYSAFLAHVGRAPTPRHSIDRINVNGNYEPGNVRWATQKQQVHNRRKGVDDHRAGRASGALSFGA